jgi:GNAT superfamily N-acetyltransferase
MYIDRLFRRPKPYQGQYRVDKRAIELPAGTNMELFSATFGLMGRLTVENGFDSEKNYSQYQPKLCSSLTSHESSFYNTGSLTLNVVGSMLVTHPDYQCQGHAIRLVRHALKFADDTNKKWYAGLPLLACIKSRDSYIKLWKRLI